MSYVVMAGRVSVETQVSENGGRAVIDFYRGEVLPGDAPEETVRALLGGGMVADEDAASEPEPVDLSELDKDGLLAFADEHKIQVDRRLGEDNLRAAILAAVQEAE